jgi:hypothetical protein
VPAWVDSVAIRATEVRGLVGFPPDFALPICVQAFGDELLALPLPRFEHGEDDDDDPYGEDELNDEGHDKVVSNSSWAAARQTSPVWLTPGGRQFAADYLLPLAEAALCSVLAAKATPA